MKRDIKRLVNKYYKKVEQETISCGLGCCENDLKEEAEEIIENFYNDVVGNNPMIRVQRNMRFGTRKHLYLV